MGAETWTLRKVDQKYLESFEMLCWRRVEKILKNEAVMDRVKERNIVHRVKRNKSDCIGQILLRNCLLKHFVEDNIEGRVWVA